MELELGLGISSNGFSNKGFDLNCYGSDSNGDEPPGECNSEKKRGFGEAYDHQHQQGNSVVPPKTLPLLSWDNYKQPNEEEDDQNDLDQNSSTSNNYEEEEGGVVGWPPIKSWRKKLCRKNNVFYGGGSGGRGGGGGGDGGGGGSNSSLVKVKMEGVVIARKVDLSLHHSYHQLKDTLVEMFGRGEENVEAYNLTYQDKEGDWLLAGDVPWSSFIESVQRLKLLRRME